MSAEGTHTIRARLRIPGQEVVEYRSEHLERFSGMEDYWMKREGVLFFPFDPQRDAYFIPAKGGSETDVQVPLIPNDPLEEEEFKTSILMAKHAISQGELSKVVLARNEFGGAGIDADKVFDNALSLHPESYCYQIDLGKEQWVGASPELLLHYESGTLYTVALAGTRLAEEAFGPKEVLEQEMVEAFIEERLAGLGLTVVDRSDKKEVEYDRIKHLRTDYRVECDPATAMRAVLELHPTSAVCGLPRDPALHFIMELETMERGFYAGLTGWMQKDRATFFVNLRCLRIVDGRAELFAGAGITSDSDADSEWKETQRKIDSIRHMI